MATSTINKTGEDYASLSQWENAKNGDITSGDPEIAVCYDDDGALADSVSIVGWTTDADSYVEIKSYDDDTIFAANEGVPSDGSSGKGFLLSPAEDSNGIIIQEDYVKVHDIQIKLTLSAMGNRSAIGCYGQTNGANLLEIYNNVLRAVATGDCGTSGGIDFDDADITAYCYNNILYDFCDDDGSTDLFGILGDQGTALYIHNNTVYNCCRGIASYGASGLHCFNNISYCYAVNNNFEDFNGTSNYVSGGDYNISSDGTGNDNNLNGGHNQVNQTLTFKSVANDDFRLDADDTNAIDGGTDNPESLGVFTTDIEGNTRSTPWDVGASEVAGGGGGFSGAQVI